MKSYLLFVSPAALFCLILVKALIPQASFSSFLPSSQTPTTPTTTPTSTPAISPSPSPKAVKPSGPCAYLPVLMYHHIQSQKQATDNGQTKFTVTPDFFKKHLEYLKSRGYTFVFPTDIANFFNNKTPLPPKPVMITFDDAYEDVYTNAFPLLKELGVKAVIFTPTGLLENSGYLNWGKLKEMTGSGLVIAANHTWSHANLQKVDSATQAKEVLTADTQLSQNGLNNPKIFAYPYGSPASAIETLLSQNQYQLAFTTIPGRQLCLSERFRLPRVRVGNTPLSSYGL